MLAELRGGGVSPGGGALRSPANDASPATIGGMGGSGVMVLMPQAEQYRQQQHGAGGMVPVPGGKSVTAPASAKRAGENGGADGGSSTPGTSRRGWTPEMESELYRLLQQQTKGVPGVSEDRIAWQVIRAVSETMSHLSKDAIRYRCRRTRDISYVVFLSSSGQIWTNKPNCLRLDVAGKKGSVCFSA
jgi:hypothetical protein